MTKIESINLTGHHFHEDLSVSSISNQLYILIEIDKNTQMKKHLIKSSDVTNL